MNVVFLSLIVTEGDDSSAKHLPAGKINNEHNRAKIKKVSFYGLIRQESGKYITKHDQLEILTHNPLFLGPAEWQVFFCCIPVKYVFLSIIR